MNSNVKSIIFLRGDESFTSPMLSYYTLFPILFPFVTVQLGSRDSVLIITRIKSITETYSFNYRTIYR